MGNEQGRGGTAGSGQTAPNDEFTEYNESVYAMSEVDKRTSTDSSGTRSADEPNLMDEISPASSGPPPQSTDADNASVQGVIEMSDQERGATSSRVTSTAEAGNGEVSSNNPAARSSTSTPSATGSKNPPNSSAMDVDQPMPTPSRQTQPDGALAPNFSPSSLPSASSSTSAATTSTSATNNSTSINGIHSSAASPSNTSQAPKAKAVSSPASTVAPTAGHNVPKSAAPTVNSTSASESPSKATPAKPATGVSASAAPVAPSRPSMSQAPANTPVAGAKAPGAPPASPQRPTKAAASAATSGSTPSTAQRPSTPTLPTSRAQLDASSRPLNGPTTTTSTSATASPSKGSFSASSLSNGSSKTAPTSSIKPSASMTPTPPREVASASLQRSGESRDKLGSDAALSFTPATVVGTISANVDDQWHEVRDSVGRAFYYKKLTRETSWAKPASYIPLQLTPKPPANAYSTAQKNPTPASSAQPLSSTTNQATGAPPKVASKPTAATANVSSNQSQIPVKPTASSSTTPSSAPTTTTAKPTAAAASTSSSTSTTPAASSTSLSSSTSNVPKPAIIFGSRFSEEKEGYLGIIRARPTIGKHLLNLIYALGTEAAAKSEGGHELSSKELASILLVRKGDDHFVRSLQVHSYAPLTLEMAIIAAYCIFMFKELTQSRPTFCMWLSMMFKAYKRDVTIDEEWFLRAQHGDYRPPFGHSPVIGSILAPEPSQRSTSTATSTAKTTPTKAAASQPSPKPTSALSSTTSLSSSSSMLPSSNTLASSSSATPAPAKTAPGTTPVSRPSVTAPATPPIAAQTISVPAPSSSTLSSPSPMPSSSNASSVPVKKSASAPSKASSQTTPSVAVQPAAQPAAVPVVKVSAAPQAKPTESVLPKQTAAAASAATTAAPPPTKKKSTKRTKVVLRLVSKRPEPIDLEKVLAKVSDNISTQKARGEALECLFDGEDVKLPKAAPAPSNAAALLREKVTLLTQKLTERSIQLDKEHEASSKSKATEGRSTKKRAAKAVTAALAEPSNSTPTAAPSVPLATPTNSTPTPQAQEQPAPAMPIRVQLPAPAAPSSPQPPATAQAPPSLPRNSAKIPSDSSPPVHDPSSAYTLLPYTANGGTFATSPNLLYSPQTMNWDPRQNASPGNSVSPPLQVPVQRTNPGPMYGQVPQQGLHSAQSYTQTLMAHTPAHGMVAPQHMPQHVPQHMPQHAPQPMSRPLVDHILVPTLVPSTTNATVSNLHQAILAPHSGHALAANHLPPRTLMRSANNGPSIGMQPPPVQQQHPNQTGFSAPTSLPRIQSSAPSMPATTAPPQPMAPQQAPSLPVNPVNLLSSSAPGLHSTASSGNTTLASLPPAHQTAIGSSLPTAMSSPSRGLPQAGMDQAPPSPDFASVSTPPSPTQTPGQPRQPGSTPPQVRLRILPLSRSQEQPPPPETYASQIAKRMSMAASLLAKVSLEHNPLFSNGDAEAPKRVGRLPKTSVEANGELSTSASKSRTTLVIAGLSRDALTRMQQLYQAVYPGVVVQAGDLSQAQVMVVDLAKRPFDWTTYLAVLCNVVCVSTDWAASCIKHKLLLPLEPYVIPQALTAHPIDVPVLRGHVLAFLGRFDPLLQAIISRCLDLLGLRYYFAKPARHSSGEVRWIVGVKRRHWATIRILPDMDDTDEALGADPRLHQASTVDLDAASDHSGGASPRDMSPRETSPRPATEQPAQRYPFDLSGVPVAGEWRVSQLFDCLTTGNQPGELAPLEEE